MHLAPYLSNELISDITKLFDNPRDLYIALGFIGFFCRVYRLQKGKNKFNFGVPSVWWGKVIGEGRFNKILKTLRRADVISTNGYYAPGIQTKRYKLADRYENNEYFFFKEYDDLVKNKKGLVPYGGPFMEKIRAMRLKELTAPQAARIKQYVELLGQLAFAPEIAGAISTQAADPTWNNERQNNIDYILEVFASREHDASISKKTGRVFSSLTSVTRWARPYLRLNGESLVEVDTDQCQINLLSTLYGESAADLKEKARFLKFISDQRIYNYYCSDLAIEKRKKAFLAPIMGKRGMHNSPIFKSFAADFPRLADHIATYKIEDHCDMSVYLQALEADIFVSGVFDECLKKGIYCLTIHDAVLCRPEDRAQISEIICKCFAAKVGFRPVLKVSGVSSNIITHEILPLAA